MKTVRTRGLVARKEGQTPSVETVEIRLPLPADTVLVRMEASGLCHSDVSAWSGDFSGLTRFPLLLGHEGACVIEAIGSGITDLRPGDVCAVLGRSSCGNCALCVRGRPVLCVHGADLIAGTEGMSVRPTLYPGTLCERIVVPRSSVLPMPGVPMRVRALFGCLLTTAFGAVVNTAQVTPGMRVVVLGAGGIGLGCTMVCKAAGATTIAVFDRLERRRAIALDMGATHFTVLPSDPTAAETAILAVVQDADVCIDCSGHAPLVRVGCHIVRSGGTVVLVGIPPWDIATPSVNFAEFIIFEKRLLASFGSAGNPQHVAQQALRMYQAGLLPVERLVTREYTSLEDFPQALQDMAMGNIDGRALLIHTPSPKL